MCSLTTHLEYVWVLFTIETCVFLQSERVRFGRQYSDDESEFTYDQASELMATELASERRLKSEPAQKMLRPVKKVCVYMYLACTVYTAYTTNIFMMLLQHTLAGSSFLAKQEKKKELASVC